MVYTIRDDERIAPFIFHDKKIDNNGAHVPQRLRRKSDWKSYEPSGAAELLFLQNSGLDSMSKNLFEIFVWKDGMYAADVNTSDAASKPP